MHSHDIPLKIYRILSQDEQTVVEIHVTHGLLQASQLFEF